MVDKKLFCTQYVVFVSTSICQHTVLYLLLIYLVQDHLATYQKDFICLDLICHHPCPEVA